MPFQDYEIIQTKRVNKGRKNMTSIFFYRLWLSSGSFSTLYASSLAAYAVHMHQKAFNPSIFAVAPKNVAAPAAFGVAFLFSVSLFGDMKEFKHLLRNYLTYRREFKMIKDELYNWVYTAASLLKTFKRYQSITIWVLLKLNEGITRVPCKS